MDSTFTGHIRKGARRLSEIPPHVLAALNKGETQTVNLMEGLAIDNKALLSYVLSAMGRDVYVKEITGAIDLLSQKTITKVNMAIGSNLLRLARQHQDQELISHFSSHTSDVVRGWASYMIGLDEDLSIQDKLGLLKPFAADPHFGVREFAWMVVRNGVIKELDKSIRVLEPWSKDGNENIRRFASEVTRPRGVWCAHIEKLKQDPGLARSILEPLKSDTSRYVQNSVGNWLNDAAKTRPEWVRSVCELWQKDSISKETIYIIKRGLRSLS